MGMSTDTRFERRRFSCSHEKADSCKPNKYENAAIFEENERIRIFAALRECATRSNADVSVVIQGLKKDAFRKPAIKEKP
jgi:hypothetical protein